MKFCAGIIVVAVAGLAFLPGCGPAAGQPTKPAAPQAAAPATDPAKAAEAERYLAQGLKDYGQYKYRAAVANFDKAIAADPANYKVYTAKGIALCCGTRRSSGRWCASNNGGAGAGAVVKLYCKR
jgi:hypothetical protein